MVLLLQFRGAVQDIDLSDGLRLSGLTASLALDGAINDETFLSYVEQFPVPTLAPEDTFIMDNLSSQKVTGVRKAIEACGARLLFLPPCSPDLDPVK